MVEQLRKLLGQRKATINPQEATGCTFTYSWEGKIECGYPRDHCLKEILKAEGTEVYLHHGQMVEGDCAIEASQPDYTPHESRGDPR